MSDHEQQHHPNEISVPDEAWGDTEAFEVLTAWLIQHQLFVWLNVAWARPEHCGMLLADMARGMSNVLLAERGADRDEVLEQIMSVMRAELERPTTDIETRPMEQTRN